MVAWQGGDNADITANLEALHRNGIGGVNILRLLDVRDDAVVKLSFMPSEWAEAIVNAVSDAH